MQIIHQLQIIIKLIQLLDIGEMSRTPALISFILNTLLLNLNSLHIGLASKHLNDSDYLCLIKELKCLPRIIFKTISDSEIVLKSLAKEYI